MKVCLDLHDFSVVNSRLELLLKLKEHFPGFKISLFTVPLDTQNNWGQFLVRPEFLKKLKEHLDWIQIIPHGLHHHHWEMNNFDYQTFRGTIMPAIKEAFDRDGLPFVRGFCAPYWRWSADVVKALDDEGWWGAVDRRRPNMLSTKVFFKYSHCLDEPFDMNADILKLHGHTYGTRNDVGRCFENILKLPQSVEWHFATDFLEEKI